MDKKLDLSFIKTLLTVSNTVDEGDSEGLDYKWIETKEYKKPFKRNDIIKAEIMGQGRYKTERIAAAKNRTIMLPKVQRDYKKGDMVKVKITKSNHNIFVGEVTR